MSFRPIDSEECDSVNRSIVSNPENLVSHLVFDEGAADSEFEDLVYDGGDPTVKDTGATELPEG